MVRPVLSRRPVANRAPFRRHLAGAYYSLPGRDRDQWRRRFASDIKKGPPPPSQSFHFPRCHYQLVAGTLLHQLSQLSGCLSLTPVGLPGGAPIASQLHLEGDRSLEVDMLTGHGRSTPVGSLVVFQHHLVATSWFRWQCFSISWWPQISLTGRGPQHRVHSWSWLCGRVQACIFLRSSSACRPVGARLHAPVEALAGSLQFQLAGVVTRGEWVPLIAQGVGSH